MAHDCSIPVIAEGVYPFEMRARRQAFPARGHFGALAAPEAGGVHALLQRP